jgi:hypothetical protein
MMKCNVSNGKEWNARLFNQVRTTFSSQQKQDALKSVISNKESHRLVNPEINSFFTFTWLLGLGESETKWSQRFQHSQAMLIQVYISFSITPAHAYSTVSNFYDRPMVR